MADGQVLAELLLAHLALDSYLRPCMVSKMANEGRIQYTTKSRDHLGSLFGHTIVQLYKDMMKFRPSLHLSSFNQWQEK